MSDSRRQKGSHSSRFSFDPHFVDGKTLPWFAALNSSQVWSRNPAMAYFGDSPRDRDDFNNNPKMRRDNFALISP
jgi:hypothetical protein